MDIIYFKTSNSSFILTDKHILEKHFNIETFHINNKNGFRYLFSLLHLLFFLLVKGWRSKIYFIRFADWHTALLSLFSKLYKTKMVIVVGGFDAYHLPEYAYGVYHNKFRGFCAKYALRNADLIIPNSPCLIENTNTYASSKPIRGGIMYFEPRIKGRIEVVYNGFNTEYCKIVASSQKKDIILTVALVNTMRTYRLKGIDSYIELARVMPGKSFKIIGLNKDFINKHNIDIPSNLEVFETLPYNELLQYYQEARIFCLFSLTEGMSNVLCEAMLCECIPVGTNVTFIPEIIGDTGFIIMKKNISEMKQKVEEALNTKKPLGQMAKQRIIARFSMEARETALVALMKELLL